MASILPAFPIIPTGTVQIALMIRHGHSILRGSELTRTLSLSGRDHLRKLAPFYQSLLAYLEGMIKAEPVFYASEFIRSELSLWELFAAEQILREPALNYEFTLGDISPEIENLYYPMPVDDALPELLGLGEFQWVRGFETHCKLMADVAGYNQFLRYTQDPLIVAGGHEFALSMQAHHYGKYDELGLYQGWAYLYCLDADKRILSIKRINPIVTK